MKKLGVVSFALLSGLPFTAAAVAQSPGPTAYGNFNSTYNAPSTGYPGTSWGTYHGTVGGNWQYNRTMKSSEPVGSVVDPNQANTNFANPRTGATLFHPQDTRLKGRDRP